MFFFPLAPRGAFLLLIFYVFNVLKNKYSPKSFASVLDLFLRHQMCLIFYQFHFSAEVPLRAIKSTPNHTDCSFHLVHGHHLGSCLGISLITLLCWIKSFLYQDFLFLGLPLSWCISPFWWTTFSKDFQGEGIREVNFETRMSKNVFTLIGIVWLCGMI